MRIFICEDLINDLIVNIEKINDMSLQLEVNNYEAFFVYSFSLFESSICEVLRRVLAAFPEKLSDDKQLKLKYSEIFKNIYSFNYIVDTIIDTEIKSISKGNAVSLIQKAEKLMAIKIEFNNEILEEVSWHRNRLVHDNTISNREYILGYRTKKNIDFNFETAKVYINNLKEVLLDMEHSLKVKYQKYTKYRLIKDLWEEIFDTPLLKFDSCIMIRPSALNKNNNVVGININHLDRVAKSISSGEKFFLSLLLQQYSGSINDKYFKFKDIPSLVSITSKSKINKILHVFSIYPHLFNGEVIKELG